jgi:hypothetical protein
MAMRQWGSIDDGTKREQLKLMYDYIKFHIALYLATPTALALVADIFDVKKCISFGIFFVFMIGIYLISGISAAWFMSDQVNHAWGQNYLQKFEQKAFSFRRIFMHHYLYPAFPG